VRNVSGPTCSLFTAPTTSGPSESLFATTTALHAGRHAGLWQFGLSMLGTFSGFRFCPSVCGSIGGAPFARKTPTQAPEPGDHSSGRPCWCLHFFLRSSGVHPSLRMRWRYTGYSASLGPSRPVSYYGICSARPKNRHCDTCGRPFSQRPTQSAHFAPLRWPRGRGGPAQVATLSDISFERGHHLGVIAFLALSF
jgi:hypothetical protein